MATMQTDRLRDDYLRRLETAATVLPRERREELVDEIRAHLDAALSGAAPDDELAVRNAIERLGPPEAIVLAAVEPAAPEPRARTPWLEIAALVALVVPVGGFLAGVVLVVVSRIWSAREKVLGIALALAPVVVAFLAWWWPSGGDDELTGPGSSDDGGWWVGPLTVVGFILIAFPGLLSALFLGWRLRAHRAP